MSKLADWKFSGTQNAGPENIVIDYGQDRNEEMVAATFNVEAGELNFGEMNTNAESAYNKVFNRSSIVKANRDISKFLDNHSISAEPV